MAFPDTDRKRQQLIANKLEQSSILDMDPAMPKKRRFTPAQIQWLYAESHRLRDAWTQARDHHQTGAPLEPMLPLHLKKLKVNFLYYSLLSQPLSSRATQ